VLLSSARWLDTGNGWAADSPRSTTTWPSGWSWPHQAAVEGQSKQPLQHVVADILEGLDGPLREGYYAQGHHGTQAPGSTERTR
jgi:hypothetical protein